MRKNSKNKKRILTAVTGLSVASTLIFTSMMTYAANGDMGNRGSDMGFMDNRGGDMESMDMRGQGPSNNADLSDSASEIVSSSVENTAADLAADEANATKILMNETNNDIKISESGTYIITGSCSEGNITVKKNTEGVVLILKDLTLTSSEGAPLSINKGAEVKLIIEGEVSLTDAENPDDEDSEDEAVADAFDGAAIKAKDGSCVYLTGTGSLTIDASKCKNGIKVGDEDTPSFVIDGSLTVNIDAANDAINAGYDFTILSGNLKISAGDDAIHADRILTIGSNDGTGPVINISTCEEGFEGTVVNLFGGEGTVNANDDGINAANSDGTYSDELDFSINITDGSWTVNAGGDGLDSNGNINIVGGTVKIKSASNGGEAGIDYDGSCYISEDAVLENQSGISGPDADFGQNGNFGQNGDMRRDDFFQDDRRKTEDETNKEDIGTDEKNSEEINTDEKNTNDDSENMCGWGEGEQDVYWYEDGIRQGTYTDSKCFSYDGTVRGREIYDPATDAWYWLDSDAEGAKATGKEVFMPYVYQDEDGWNEEEVKQNSLSSDDGLNDYILECITNNSGKWVRYDEKGRMLKGWVTIEGDLEDVYPEQAGNTYYYDTKTGAMVKGKVLLNGTEYYFDEVTGVLIK